MVISSESYDCALRASKHLVPRDLCYRSCFSEAVPPPSQGSSETGDHLPEVSRPAPAAGSQRWPREKAVPLYEDRVMRRCGPSLPRALVYNPRFALQVNRFKGKTPICDSMRHVGVSLCFFAVPKLSAGRFRLGSTTVSKKGETISLHRTNTGYSHVHTGAPT